MFLIKNRMPFIVVVLACAACSMGSSLARELATNAPPVAPDGWTERLWIEAPPPLEDDGAFLGEGVFRPLKRLVPELGESLVVNANVRYEQHASADRWCYLGGAFFGYNILTGTRSLDLHADTLEYRFSPPLAGDWALCLGFSFFGPGNDCSWQPTGAACFIVLRRSFNAFPIEW